MPTGKRSEHPRGTPIGHTHAHFKRAGEGTSGILEWKFLSKNAHRTAISSNPLLPNESSADGGGVNPVPFQPMCSNVVAMTRSVAMPSKVNVLASGVRIGYGFVGM
jgi:hypothetical protein